MAGWAVMKSWSRSQASCPLAQGVRSRLSARTSVLPGASSTSRSLVTTLRAARAGAVIWPATSRQASAVTESFSWAAAFLAWKRKATTRLWREI